MSLPRAIGGGASLSSCAEWFAAMEAAGAANSGSLAAVREGDTIIIDTPNRRLDVELSDDEIAKRMAKWSPPASKYTQGVLAKYAALVTQADNGAIMRVGFDL